MKPRGILLALALVVLAASPAYGAGPDRSPVRSFADGSVVPGASSSLLSNAAGIAFTLNTSGLPAGDAVTVWWVIFNDPTACAGVTPGHPFRCGPTDLFNPATQASLQYASGHVVGITGSTSFAGHLAIGDGSGCAASFLPCNGLLNPTGADVHLVIHDHGPADPTIVSGQIQSFNVCNPSCIDLQFSVHEQ